MVYRKLVFSLDALGLLGTFDFFAYSGLLGFLSTFPCLKSPLLTDWMYAKGIARTAYQGLRHSRLLELENDSQARVAFS